MVERRAETLVDGCADERRQALKLLSAAAFGALALALAGCAAGSAENWDKPVWMRSKRGTNGNGAGRR
jgi:hypothetical protein